MAQATLALSRSMIAPMGAIVETTYGTDPGLAGGTDDVLAIQSPAPIQLDQSVFEFRPHTSTFTRSLDIMARRLWRLNTTFLFQPSGNSASASVLGFKGQAALMRCCGLTEAVTTSITYTPSTIALLKSATVVSEYNGLYHKTTGVYGNLRMTGDPSTGCVCTFSGFGQYIKPTIASLSGWTGGTNRAFNNLGIALTVNNGASYTPVAFSYAFDMGVSVDEIPDMNNAQGFYGALFGDRNPTLALSLGMGTFSGVAGTEITYDEWYTDMEARTTHNISWILGTAVASGGYGKGTFSFPTAQLRSINTAERGRLRQINLGYKVQASSPNQEFSITLSDT